MKFWAKSQWEQKWLKKNLSLLTLTANNVLMYFFYIPRNVTLISKCVGIWKSPLLSVFINSVWLGREVVPLSAADMMPWQFTICSSDEREFKLLELWQKIGTNRQPPCHTFTDVIENTAANATACVMSVPVSRLETSLGQSEQRVCELSRALAQSEEQLSQLQTLSQSQQMQIQQLQDVCAQLGGVREMNEVSL